MGKKSWFSVVKKAIRPSCSKVKKDKRSQKSKSKKIWQGNEMRMDTCSSSQTEAASLANPPYDYPLVEETEYKQQPDNIEQIKHVDPISYTTTVMEEVEDAVSVSQQQEDMEDVESCAATDVNCIISSPRFLGKSREEIGVIKIQTVYRGYLARKILRGLRAQRRLHMLIESQAVKRQTTSALMTLQTMGRVQSQVRTRKVRMAEVNEALQRQLLQRREKELDKQSGWDLSPKSKEQVEASLRRKKDAAERREKALAYAYCRQQTWRNSLKSANPTLMDPNFPNWGWNWSERWDANRPWETRTTNITEPAEVTRQSPPVTSPSKALSSVSAQRLKSAKSTNVKSRVSNTGPRPLGLVRKGGLNTGSGVGSTKKRQLVSGSASLGGKTSLGAPRKSLITLR